MTKFISTIQPPNWISDDTEFSVTYPIAEITRRVNLKVKIFDRDIPMTSDVWGGKFPNLVGRWRRFMDWHRNNVKAIKVFYEPAYYIANRQSLELLDPLHMDYVTRYAGIKD